MRYLKKERDELKNFPDAELLELVSLYERKGLSKKTATAVAEELTKKDAFAAHADIELGIDPDNLTNPWHAAFASAAAFLAGAFIPLVAIIIPPPEMKVPFAFAAVVVALAATGFVSAKIGGANTLKAMTRVVLGGVLAMIVTYSIGRLFHISGV